MMLVYYVYTCLFWMLLPSVLCTFHTHTILLVLVFIAFSFTLPFAVLVTFVYTRTALCTVLPPPPPTANPSLLLLLPCNALINRCIRCLFYWFCRMGSCGFYRRIALPFISCPALPATHALRFGSSAPDFAGRRGFPNFYHHLTFLPQLLPFQLWLYYPHIPYYGYYIFIWVDCPLVVADIPFT